MCDKFLEVNKTRKDYLKNRGSNCVDISYSKIKFHKHTNSILFHTPLFSDIN